MATLSVTWEVWAQRVTRPLFSSMEGSWASFEWLQWHNRGEKQERDTALMSHSPPPNNSDNNCRWTQQLYLHCHLAQKLGCSNFISEIQFLLLRILSQVSTSNRQHFHLALTFQVIPQPISFPYRNRGGRYEDEKQLFQAAHTQKKQLPWVLWQLLKKPAWMLLQWQLYPNWIVFSQ